MKSAILAAAMVALFANSAGVDAQQYTDDVGKNRALSRAPKIWGELYARDIRAWRTAYVLIECGYPVPAGLLPMFTELTEEVTERVEPDGELDLTNQIALVLAGMVTGYQLGFSDALKAADEALGTSGPPPVTTCREARETAEDILALR